MSTIATRVRELRLARGLSQQALVGEGISAGYVSLIESGKRVPSERTTVLLAERLGVPVEQLLEPTTSPAAEQAQVEVNFARLALANGNPAETVRCLTQVDLQQLDSRTAREAALALASGLEQTGHLEEAVAVLEALVERSRQDESWLTFATAASVLAVMYIESGDVAHSVDVAGAALKEIKAVGLEGTDEHLRLGAVFVLACHERGDLLHATRRVEELIEVADRVGSTRARGSIYWNAAIVAHGRGRTADAVQLTDRAVALLAEQEESRDLPRLRMHYAWLLLNHEVPLATEALQQIDRAESDLALAGARLDLGVAATLRGRAYLVLGQFDDAAEQAARSLRLLGASEHVERVSALILLGDVGTARLEADLAKESFGEAERVLFRMPSSRIVARLWRDLGDGLRDFEETHRALDAYDRSFRILGMPARPASSRTPAPASSDAVVVTP